MNIRARATECAFLPSLLPNQVLYYLASFFNQVCAH